MVFLVLALLTSPEYRGWGSYGGGPEQIRYSSLRQIHRGNVRDLEVAWTYDTGETGGLQTQPIIVDGVLYALTPSHKAFALRAATGELLWAFDSGIESQGPNRGVMYWASGPDRRVFAAGGGRAGDAPTGGLYVAFALPSKVEAE